MAENNRITSELGRILGRTSESGPASITGPITALPEAIAQNTTQLAEVRNSMQKQLESLLDNTRALVENTTKAQGTGSRIGSAATSVASSMFGGGLLGPLISGLFGLFGRHSEDASPETLTKFALPAPIRVDAGLQGGSAGTVSYGQNDVPRVAAASKPAASTSQVTVNVTAMDSRSFLDHSTEIANAVKRALLESNSLSDVIGEL